MLARLRTFLWLAWITGKETHRLREKRKLVAAKRIGDEREASAPSDTTRIYERMTSVLKLWTEMNFCSDDSSVSREVMKVEKSLLRRFQPRLVLECMRGDVFLQKKGPILRVMNRIVLRRVTTSLCNSFDL